MISPQTKRRNILMPNTHKKASDSSDFTSLYRRFVLLQSCLINQIESHDITYRFV